MNHKKISIGIVLLVIIAIVFMLLSNRKDQEPQQPEPEQPQVSEEEVEVLIEKAVTKFKETLTTKHQYVGEEHVFLGNFQLPNPCYNYTSGVVDEGADKFINIEYVRPEIANCPSREPVERGFVITFKAPEGQSVRARINNEEVNLNIVEVPADANIVEYEI